MSAPALIRKQDIQRAAEVAKGTGCRVEIKIGDATVTLYPEPAAIPAKSTPKNTQGVDYSRPVL